MIKLGITGGIGSGKSIVCEIFSKFGVPVYNADNRAKWLMSNDPRIKNALIEKWGSEIYKNDQLDRTMLAGIIFDNALNVEYVNSLVHPAVGNDFKQWCENLKDEPFIIKEAALLFESNAYLELDHILTVVAPLEIRLNRVCKRDQVNREQVLKRIQHQLSDDEKIKRSDYIIYNNEEISLLEQVLNLHQILISGKK